MVADFRDTAGVWKVQTQLDIQDISSAAFHKLSRAKDVLYSLCLSLKDLLEMALMYSQRAPLLSFRKNWGNRL
jgi:hypothetical protein